MPNAFENLARPADGVTYTNRETLFTESCPAPFYYTCAGTRHPNHGENTLEPPLRFEVKLLSSMKMLDDTPNARARYAELADQSRTASVYHAPEWLRVFEALSYRLRFVEVDRDTLVPFVCVGSGPLRRAYSLPYDTYGGPVTRSPAGAPISFPDLAAVLRIPTVRVVDFHGALTPEGAAVERKTTHIVALDVDGGYDAVHRTYSKRNREALRQGERRGIEVTIASDRTDVDAFRKLYEHTSQQHGTRPLPPGFFEAVHEFMSPVGMARFYLARHEGNPIAGHLTLQRGQDAYAWGLGYDDAFLQLRPANALIDRAIRDAVSNGAARFNLGMSPSSGRGILRFKQSFGTEPYEYQILIREGALFRTVRNLVRSNKWLSSRL